MTWVRVGELSEFNQGEGFRFESGEHRVAMFRVDDSVYAIGDRCSHAEASLAEGEVDDLEVECPRHGALFDLTDGRAISLPATKPVPGYEVRVADDVVFLRLENA